MQAQALEPEELRNVIRTSGLRATPSRLAVLQLLLSDRRPISHADVAEQLGDRGWDRATLYRNLLDLTRAGLARRTDVGDHVWRFEAREEPGVRDQHPHFVCNACGDVQCLDALTVSMKSDAQVPRALKRKDYEIQIKGTCDGCT